MHKMCQFVKIKYDERAHVIWYVNSVYLNSVFLSFLPLLRLAWDGGGGGAACGKISCVAKMMRIVAIMAVKSSSTATLLKALTWSLSVVLTRIGPFHRTHLISPWFAHIITIHFIIRPSCLSCLCGCCIIIYFNNSIIFFCCTIIIPTRWVIRLSARARQKRASRKSARSD